MQSVYGKKVIAHLVSPYLFLAGSWIYGQIRNIRDYRQLVLTNRKENLEIFPFRPIYCYGELLPYDKVYIRLRDYGFKDVYYNFYSRVLKKQQASLIHCHFGHCGAEFVDVKRKLRLPMVTSFYGSDMSSLPRDSRWKVKYEMLFEEGERFLVEGSHMKAQLVGLGCPEAKLINQHLGVDLEDLPMLPRIIGANGTVKILIASSFREKKGIPYALDAFARVRRKHRNMRLTLIGDAADKPSDTQEKEKILDLLRKHDLDGAVTWLGFQPLPLFRKALLEHHLFLSPSIIASDGDSEGGSPVSITEAQATGMPVVSTFHADIPEVVLNGKTGLLSPERDVDALAANLEFLVTHPECWGQMGREAREHIEAEYNVKVQAKRLEHIYSDLLSN